MFMSAQKFALRHVLLLGLAAILPATSQVKESSSVTSASAVKMPTLRTATAVTSGQTINFTLPFANGTTLYNGEYSHTIEVPSGATQLSVILQANIDVDLYVRRGQDVFLSGTTVGSIVADYRSESFSGSESISVANPPSGTYYIAYTIFGGGGPASVSMTATVTAPAACTFSFSPSNSASVTAAQTSGSFTVNTGTSCSWTAVSDSAWLTVQTPSGTGTGLIQYQVAPNTGAVRTGRITVAGVAYTVTQAGGSVSSLPENALLVSQFVAGGGQWNTTIFLTNLSTATESFTLSFYDDAGLPQAMPIVGLGSIAVITGTLAAGETRRYETAPKAQLQVGWATIIPGSASFRRLGGFAVFRQDVGAASSEAIVNFTGPRDTKQVLLFDTTQGFETGVALSNPDSVNFVDILVEIRQDNGAVLGTDTIRLPPMGHTSFEVSRRFPLAANRQGSIRLNATPRNITGLGLRFAGSSQFTSFPLLTSPDAQ